MFVLIKIIFSKIITVGGCLRVELSTQESRDSREGLSWQQRAIGEGSADSTAQHITAAQALELKWRTKSTILLNREHANCSVIKLFVDS